MRAEKSESAALNHDEPCHDEDLGSEIKTRPRVSDDMRGARFFSACANPPLFWKGCRSSSSFPHLQSLLLLGEIAEEYAGSGKLNLQRRFPEYLIWDVASLDGGARTQGGAVSGPSSGPPPRSGSRSL